MASGCFLNEINMNNDKIANLAREYAEEIYPNLSDKIISLRTQEIKNAERMLTWLSHRFYLVEKGTVKEQYKDAQKDQHNPKGDFALSLAGRNRSAVLIELFPEIAKEVEGVVKCIVDTTMMYTDALIDECEKGGTHD